MKLPLISILALALQAAWLPLSAQTWGTPTVISETGEVVDSKTTCKLTGSLLVAAYADRATLSGQVALCRMERGQIEKIASLAFDEDGAIAGGSPLSLTRLSDTRFLLLYQDSSPIGRALIGEVTESGGLRWAGPSVPFSLPSKAVFFTTATLTPERVLIAFYGESDRQGRVLVGKINGGSLTLGPVSYVTRSEVNAFNSLAALSSTEFVLAYTANTLGGHAVLRAGRVDGDQIVLGAPFLVDQRNSPYIQIEAVDADRCLVGYYAEQGIQLALVKVTSGSFQVVERASPDIQGAMALFNMDALGGNRFVLTLRHDAANRDSPVFLAMVSATGIKIDHLATKSDQASLQEVVALHSRVVVLAQIISGHRIELTAMAVTQ